MVNSANPLGDFKRLPGHLHGPFSMACGYLTYTDSINFMRSSKAINTLVKKELKSDPNYFKECIGEATTDELRAAKGSNNRLFFFQSFKDIKVRQFLYNDIKNHEIVSFQGNGIVLHKLDELKGIQKLIATVKYYSGLNQLNIRRNLKRMSQVGLSNAETLSRQASPQNLPELRDRCKRIDNIIWEAAGMKDAITESSKALQENTQKLHSFIRIPLKAIQLFFSIFYSGAHQSIERDLVVLKGTDASDVRNLFKRVSSNGTGYGIKVGETRIPQEEKAIRVFAQPQRSSYVAKRHLSHFNNDYLFSLSVDGRKIADFRLYMERKQWMDSKRVFQQIFVKDVNENNYRTENDDLPLLRRLVQLVVEIMHYQKSELLEWNNSHHQAHVLIAGGFKTNEAIERGITMQLTEARQNGKVFPPYHDEASFPLTVTNRPKNPVLAKRADFFPETHKTWGQVIQEEPILFGQDPLL